MQLCLWCEAVMASEVSVFVLMERPPRQVLQNLLWWRLNCLCFVCGRVLHVFVDGMRICLRGQCLCVRSLPTCNPSFVLNACEPFLFSPDWNLLLSQLLGKYAIVLKSRES